MPSIYDAIRADHNTHRDLLNRIDDTSGDSAERQAAWKEFYEDVKSHAAAEEETFYSKLISKTWGQDAARHSVAEHKELDDFVEQLEGYDMSGPKWLPTAQELCQRLLHHLDEEEKEVFPVAGKALADDEKDSLAKDYESDMERRRNGDG